MPIADHELRYALANELHARPFPALAAPCRAAFLAIKQPDDAAARDRSADLAHLVSLLDRHGASHPQPRATHWFGRIGKYRLKWESHTEFVTYTIFGDGVAERPFDPAFFEVFPDDWLAEAPGRRMTSALVRVEAGLDEDAILDRLGQWFEQESLAASTVLDSSAVIASDFRIDSAGHMRFAVFAAPGVGERRIGRIVQRLTEIETYKMMSMLGLKRGRDLEPVLSDVDARLTRLMADMTGDAAAPEATLKALLGVWSELETLLAGSAFRFGATGAYAALVEKRIEVLREERFGGRQTFTEFMTRRFDPSMRTVVSIEARLKAMAERAMRAGELLRTRVDVSRSAQNQELLQSMDRRAALQLRLQRTVEGLSVVAISYYAVNLAVYLLSPLAVRAGWDKTVLAAATTPFVIAAVWLLVRRIRRSLH